MKYLSSLTLKQLLLIGSGLGILVAVTGAVYYHARYLEPTGSAYNRTIATEVTRLDEACRTLATKSDRFLLEQALVSAAEKEAQLNDLGRASDTIRDELRRFGTTLDSLPPAPVSFTSAHYQKSLQLQDQGGVVIAEITGVLDEYESLLDFLPRYYGLRQEIETDLDRFNGVSDLDTLATDVTGLYQDARTIEAKANALRIAKVPRGFTTQTKDVIELSDRIVRGLRAQAVAFQPPNDLAISSAAQRLESLTAEHDTLNSTSLDGTLQTLPVIKSVSELAETTDRFRLSM